MGRIILIIITGTICALSMMAIIYILKHGSIWGYVILIPLFAIFIFALSCFYSFVNWMLFGFAP
jgi:hypothetical protein